MLTAGSRCFRRVSGWIRVREGQQTSDGSRLEPLVAIAVSILLVLSVFAALGVAPAAASDHIAPDDLAGNGTESNPYVITNASELQAMEDDLGANYTLGDDIDASGTSSWNSGDGFEASSHGVAGPPSDND